MIEGGKKMVYKFDRTDFNGKKRSYLDTIVVSKGKLYEKDTLNHPLRQFYLSYPEWKTIHCIIAVDERNYWDKQMIGLIEKSGKLRISYKNKKMYLTPVGRVDTTNGEWTWKFKSKLMEICISAHLDDTNMLRHLRGNGTLFFKSADKTFEEPVYLVYEIE